MKCVWGGGGCSKIVSEYSLMVRGSVALSHLGRRGVIFVKRERERDTDVGGGESRQYFRNHFVIIIKWLLIVH